MDFKSIQQNKRAILIPTYEGHFDYVFYLLSSMEKFVLDVEQFDICLILSSQEEQRKIQNMISQFRKLHIFCYDIEQILNFYGVKDKDILNKVGKFSYQTIKKLYGVHFLQYPQTYVMDSEGLFIKDIQLNTLFDDYFKHPFVLMCSLARCFGKSFYTTLNFYTVKNVAEIFNKEQIDNFYFDGFNWFYDIKIVNNLFEHFHNNLYEVIKDVSVRNKSGSPKTQAVFECILYYEYIYEHNQRYKYDFIDTIPLIEQTLGKNTLASALVEMGKNYAFFPVLMHSWEFMNINDVGKYAEIYRKLNFKIARLFGRKITIDGMDKKIEAFVENSGICLAVSTTNLQETIMQIKTKNRHIRLLQDFLQRTLCKKLKIEFGNKNMMERISFFFTFTSFEKLKKHVRNFITPIKKICKWCVEPFSIVFYFIKFLLDIVRHLKIVLLG